ncbi:hypothetical protein OAU50_08865, partial [Planctomycetota bacterium]|nr:hypothetical protein [Planctomycetota bacterium]
MKQIVAIFVVVALGLVGIWLFQTYGQPKRPNYARDNAPNNCAGTPSGLEYDTELLKDLPQ